MFRCVTGLNGFNICLTSWASYLHSPLFLQINQVIEFAKTSCAVCISYCVFLTKSFDMKYNNGGTVSPTGTKKRKANDRGFYI